MTSKYFWGSAFVLLQVTACAAGSFGDDSAQTTEALLVPWQPVIYGYGGNGAVSQTSAVAPALSRWTSDLSLYTYTEDPFADRLMLQRNQPGWWLQSGGALFPGMRSNLAAASWSDTRRDIVAVRSDGQLAHVWWDSGWGTWHSLGGAFSNATSSPAQTAIAAWGPNRLDVFSETPVDATTSVLSHTYYSGGWGPWASRGGSLARRGLTAISVASNVLDVFAIWTDQQVHRIRYSGGWSAWSTINAPASGLANGDIGRGNLLASATNSTGEIVVFTYGGDDSIYQSVEPFTAWTLVDDSHATVPGGLTAVRDNNSGTIVLVGWQSIGGAVLDAAIFE